MEEFGKLKQYAITFGKDDKFTIRYSKVRHTEYIKKLFIVLESWKFEPNPDMNLFLSDTEEEKKFNTCSPLGTFNSSSYHVHTPAIYYASAKAEYSS